MVVLSTEFVESEAVVMVLNARPVSLLALDRIEQYHAFIAPADAGSALRRIHCIIQVPLTIL